MEEKAQSGETLNNEKILSALTPLKRRLYLFAGFLSVSVGVLGIILPILDTTPFMLLAAFCFARSSPKWHRWLLNHPIFGGYIRAFRDKRGLTLKQKWQIACTTTLMLSVTAFFGPASHGIWIALPIWLACMAYLSLSRTAEAEQVKIST